MRVFRWDRQSLEKLQCVEDEVLEDTGEEGVTEEGDGEVRVDGGKSKKDGLSRDMMATSKSDGVTSETNHGICFGLRGFRSISLALHDGERERKMGEM
jgi:hypothetical protein